MVTCKKYFDEGKIRVLNFCYRGMILWKVVVDGMRGESKFFFEGWGEVDVRVEIVYDGIEYMFFLFESCF